MMNRMIRFIVRLLARIAPWDCLIACIRESGWAVAIETDRDSVEGLVIGTGEFIDRHVPEEMTKCKKATTVEFTADDIIK